MEPYSNIVLTLGVLLFSVTVHEMMHAYMAFKLGDDLAHSHGRLSLNSLKHIDPFLSVLLPAVFLLIGTAPVFAAKPVPINTLRIRGGDWGLAAVGISGPLINLALAFISGAILQIATLEGIGQQIIIELLLINVGLFTFNMLPLPPLDGSRLLYAVAPPSVQRIMEQIESLGIFMIIIILVLARPVIGPILQTANTAVLNIVL
jgi:Zn-dependent protease